MILLEGVKEKSNIVVNRNLRSQFQNFNLQND